MMMRGVSALVLPVKLAVTDGLIGTESMETELCLHFYASGHRLYNKSEAGGRTGTTRRPGRTCKL